MKEIISYNDPKSVISEQYRALRTSIQYSNVDKNMLPSLEAAKAHRALMQLHQLRDCYRQGWKPNWRNGNQCKWCIVFDTDKFMIQTMYFRSHFLSFQSEEIARKFLNNFLELIKLAGDLV